MKLGAYLYADDIIPLAESRSDLKIMLNVYGSVVSSILKYAAEVRGFKDSKYADSVKITQAPRCFLGVHKFIPIVAIGYQDVCKRICEMVQP